MNDVAKFEMTPKMPTCPTCGGPIHDSRWVGAPLLKLGVCNQVSNFGWLCVRDGKALAVQ